MSIDTKKFTYDKYPFLKELGLEKINYGCYNGNWIGDGPVHVSINPTTNQQIAAIRLGTPANYDSCIDAMNKAKKVFASAPQAKRGEVMLKLAQLLRKYKTALGALDALEMGKIAPEGEGEVQEAIDMADFAVGLSRAANGSVIPSERPDHFLMERYLPLKKHFGVITAFNFPVAVFFWNSCNSLVCGNTQIFKGATSTSLTSIVCTRILSQALIESGFPGSITCMCQGTGSTIGERLIQDKSIGLLSFTGSTEIGTHINEVCARRFARTILELGGNNALIVCEDADLDLAVRGVVFSAVGTAGQRCTTLRRLYVHEKIYDEFVPKIVKAYSTVKIGDPLNEGTLCGPLHTKQAVKDHLNGIERAKKEGGKVLIGGGIATNLPAEIKNGNFVNPTIIAISHEAPCVKDELFTPVLYIIKYKDIDEAIKYNNDVPQGLASSLFTNNPKYMFKWLGPNGSDCGIVNVNIGPSGAEIGGAFGGEKETGGGRESGSDAWKQYCQRATCTINYGDALPLAQGIQFG